MNNDNQLELNFERIQILYSNVKAGYPGVLAAIAMLYLIAARYSGPEGARAWLLIVGLANIPRLTVSFLFARAMRAGHITRHSIAPWDRYMAVSSVSAYAGFVAVIFLPFELDPVLGTALCAFVFMLLATGGVLVLSTTFSQVLIFLTLVMFSIACKFLLFQDSLFYLLAAILCFGYLQLLRYAMRQHRVLIENINLKIENKKSALIDPLTRLANRRRLSLYAEKLLPTAQRSGMPLCLLLIDIDHFKAYNDTHGHSAGDELLRQVANLLKANSREQDLVVRYGGEEFLIVLPQTTIDDADTIAARMLGAVRTNTAVTISAGMAEYDGKCRFEELVTEADKALYAAKQGGRDQLVLAA